MLNVAIYKVYLRVPHPVAMWVWCRSSLQRLFGFITIVLKPLPCNVFKMADLHVKFFQNIANSKSKYIFSKIKEIFVIINNFSCHL